MDAKVTTNRCGSPRSFGIMGAAFLLFVVALLTHCLANPPPAIRAHGQAQTIEMADNFHPTTFPEQGWQIVAPKPFGATIATWSIQPFQNTKDPSQWIDAQLNLRILDHGQAGSWHLLVSQDRTDFHHGRTSAVVAAGSSGGNGEGGITVSFLGQEQPYAADGVYEATVVGTITEAF